MKCKECNLFLISLKPKSLKETLLSSRHQAAHVSQLRQESEEAVVSGNEESLVMTSKNTDEMPEQVPPFQAETIGADDEHAVSMIMPESPTANRSYLQGK